MIKQVIVIRKDLNMRKGKIAAQAAHASFSAIMKTKLTDKDCFPFEIDDKGFISMEGYSLLAQWLRNNYVKICVYVNSEQELFNIFQQGIDRGYIVSIIQDNGLTEFKGIPTYTCLAFEPLESKDIDKITGNLPLY